MSNKDTIATWIDMLPDHKLPYLIGYIQGLIADDVVQSLLCDRLDKHIVSDKKPDTNKSVS